MFMYIVNEKIPQHVSFIVLTYFLGNWYFAALQTKAFLFKRISFFVSLPY